MNKTLPNPYYLFSFQHIASKERVSFYPQVITSNVRYDKFRFVEAPTTNLSLTPPQVFFEYLGQYYYAIYENITSGSTDIALAYNKLESGRAWVIVGDDNTQECFFEPYISNDDDFSQVIYISEQEEACIYPTPTPSPSPTSTQIITPTQTPTFTSTPTTTPSITPTNTITQTNTTTPSSTPTLTPTPSSTPPMPFNSFVVASGATALDACNNLSSGITFTAYANIAGGMGQCSPCFPFNCFPCVNTSDTWWLDAAFTIPLPDMWLANYIAPPSSNPQRQQIVGQQIVGGTFTSC